MKVLFLNHPEADYGGGFLYAGLCGVLGAKNVFDYPIKWSYHGRAHNYALPKIPDGHTSPSAWMADGFAFPYAEDVVDDAAACRAVVRMLQHGEIQLVVVESLRMRAVQAFQQCAPHCKNIPVVVHEGEDYSGVYWDKLVPLHPTLFLKRELTEEYPSADFTRAGIRVIGWPFSCPDSLIEGVPVRRATPSVDAVFLAGSTHDDRATVLQSLRASGLTLCTGTDKEGALVGWSQYIQRLRTAYLAVSARGFGLDTVRFWESAACTTLLADRRRLQYAFPFVHGDTCLEYHTPEQCGSVAADWLKYRKDDVEAIWARGRGHLRRHHTNSARAQYLLALLRDMGALQ